MLQNKNDSIPQLQMAWPEHLLNTPPLVQLPDEYAIRTYRQGDESRFYNVMELAGWSDWNDEKLRPWISKILPVGWFMIVHTPTNEIVATAMCTHNYKESNPFQGELGWLACDPAHTGRGLGTAVSAAVTARFIGAGYHNIRLYTEDFRLAAINIYLKLGYVPVLYIPEMLERWRVICGLVKRPFTPNKWHS